MNFDELMSNWQDILVSKILKSDISSSDPGRNNRVVSSSNTTTLPKPSSPSNTTPGDDSSSTSNSKQSTSSLSSTTTSPSKSKTKTKKTKVKKPKTNNKPVPLFEMLTQTSNDVTADLQHGTEGFDFHIGQQICDDSRPAVGEEAQSYFLMRHTYSYPGPWMTMMQGPSAFTGQYRLSAEAVYKDRYVLVGTYAPDTIEGVWEHTWSEHIKSHVTFVAGSISPAMKQQFMMMGQPPPTFPQGICYFDLKYNNWASRIKFDLMQNEMTLSYNRRILDNFMMGTKLISSYEKRKTSLEFGGRFEFGGGFKSDRDDKKDNDNNSNNSNSDIDNLSYTSDIASLSSTTAVKSTSKQCIETLYNMDQTMLQFMYTHGISDNAALTSKFSWKIGSDRLVSSIGYRYNFGRFPQASKSIVGEIGSDGQVRTQVSFPLLNSMLVRIYAEMNHFLTQERFRQGEMPHKFGISLNFHM